ncbi:histidine kinase [Bowmanella denitrificans]|uniref:Histidine kinase n=2 Tax=Bowmanella denitrificans TaxID=366582 RepID=A0ABN0XE37_9ALTE
MLALFLRQVPGWRFWLSGLVFWLLMNTYSADLSFRSMVDSGKHSEWGQVWLYYLPWWIPWAFLSPLIIAATKLISTQNVRTWVLRAAWLSALWLVTLCLFVFLATPMLAFVEIGGFGLEEIEQAFAILLRRGAWHLDFIIFSAIVSLGFVMQYYQRVKSEEARNESLLRQLYQLELQALKSQLNPHFLFNTLNTVASLIRLNEKNKAILALSELGLMLRKVLENQQNQLISLTQEMEFIQSYLTIQKMRFEHKLETSIQVAEDCLALNVPFMILQPLVENAVQHGSQLESDKNLLSLSIHKNNTTLCIQLINKVPRQDEHNGFGIGMKNCRDRLSKMFGQRFRLELKPLENGYFQTVLELPAETTS